MARISELQKAYGLALKCAESPDIPARERKYFRAVAHLIWKSCGDSNSEQSALVEAGDKASGVPYDADCAACLRGRQHTYREHTAILRRNHEASVGDWD